MWKFTKRRLFVSFIVLFTFWYFFGIAELEFENFTYPIEGDISVFVDQVISNRIPDVAPINLYKFKYNHVPKCEPENEPNKKLTIIVKSAVQNVNKREAIRQTWGSPRVFGGVTIRTVFNLGVSAKNSSQSQEEVEKYNDIIVGDFEDTYYNNTIKTMMGLNYAYQYCPTTDYFILVDDDYYVSIVNALKAFPPNRNSTFYSGKVHVDPPVYRNPIRKWYVSTKDYPFSKFPDFVSGGFIMLTKKTLNTFFLASQFTKHFIFDDVFIGIIAFKLQIPPIINKECYNVKPLYNGPESYKAVISSHGYDDYEEMTKVWNECRRSGYS